MLGLIVTLGNIIHKQWERYRKMLDLQKRLIQVLLDDRDLRVGSYIQQIHSTGDGRLTNTTYFFFSHDSVEKIFIKEGVKETIDNMISEYKPEDSCKCDCHVPIMTNVVPFPYFAGEYYHDDDN